MMKSNYPNSTIQRLLNVGMKRWLYSMLLILLSASSALASHYRYGVVTATRLSETGTTVTYRLNVSEAWRLGTAGTNTTFSISGGNTGTVSVPMTVVTDPSGQWSNGAGNTTLTLNKSTTPTTIRFTGCCKISTIVNNHDLSWDEHIILNTGAPGSSPVSTMPAIINMPVNAPSATYAIPATDPDPGSTLTFGTPAFTGNLAGQSNPSGFSINSTTGVITLNTVGKSIGQQYNALVTVQDQDGNRIMMDFLINMVGASTPPIFDYTVTPTNGAVYNVMVGQNVSFPIKATDGDANSTVSLSVAGLPSYITTSNFTNNALPATGNPSLTTFSWTPGAGQIGSTNVLNFIATDNVGVQTTSSVTIKVVAEPAPVFVNPTAAQGSVRQIETGQLFVDTVVAQSSLGSNVSIAFATGIPNNATQAPAIPTAGANPGQSILSWNPTPAQFGVRTLSYQATIAAYPTIFATRSFQIIVNTTPSFTSTPVTSVTVGQTYSYNVTVSDPNIPYGDTVDIIGASIPSWLTLVSTGNGTAVLSGTPTAANAGTYEIALEAEDIYHHGTNSHVHQHFDLEVLLPATITAVGNTTICQGSSVQLNANTGTGLTYQWKKDGDIILGATSATYAASVSGSYTVVVTLSGVSSTSNAVVVNVNPSVSITNCPQTQYQQIYADSNSCSTVFTYTPTITGNATTSYTFTGATTGSGSGTGSGSLFNVGQTTVTINASGACGTASCSFVVTVVDNKAPKAITKNATIYLNATGTASITPADINDGSNDNCGPVTLSLSQTGTICGFATEGQNVTLSAPAGAVITSIDFASYGTPNGSCGNYSLGWCHATNSKSIVEGYALNQNTVTIPASNGVFGDPCGGTVKRLYIQATWTGTGSATTFTCAKTGTNTVNLIVTDANGNVSTAPATVTVIDTIRPNAVAQNVTVNLGANGTGSITAAQVNNGSSDNCSISSMSVSQTNFSCADLTFNTISQVIPSNTSWSLSSAVTPYVGTCGAPFNGVSSLPAASTFSLTPILNGYVSNIIPGTDALFAENDIRYFKKSFYLSSLNDVSAEFLASVDNAVQIWINGVAVALEKDIDGANFGDNIYHRIVLGSNGVNTNGGSGYQSFDVVNAISASNLFVVGNNEIVLAVANCPAPDRGNISFKATITNKAPSTIPVTFTVTDASSNVSSVNSLVTVIDAIAPVITCTPNITAYATSPTGAIVNYTAPTATDNCTATVSLVSGLASGSNFPMGVNTVTYKAVDQSGNTTTCSFTVTVSGVAPVVVAPSEVVVNNELNKCTGKANYIAIDTVGIPASTITYSIASGSDFNVGTTQVTATATNSVGTSSVTFNVRVVDAQLPTALAQNVTIQLDASGSASTTAAAVNNGSTDNCGIASITLSKTSFDCSNVGSNNVTLTVTDVNGNVSTASAVVTVQDNIAPTITCAANVSVGSSTTSCNATVTVPAPTATDNCLLSPASIAAPFSSTAPALWIDATKFTTTNGGSLSGILTDASGHFGMTTNATYDATGFNGRPAVRYNNNQTSTNTTFNTNQNTYVFTTVQIVAPASNWASVFYHWNRDMGLTIEQNPFSPNAAPAGTAQYHFQTGNDNANVEQNITYGTTYIMAAKIVGGNVRSFTLYKDNNGTLQTIATSTNSSYSVPVQLGKLFLGKSDVGEYTNMRMGEFLYFQGSLPTSESSIVNYLHSKWFGSSGPVVTNNINNTADASGVYPLGTTTITWTARDASGNTSTCQQTVTVTDNVAPTVITKNHTVNLDANGVASITANDVNNGSTDNCGIASVTVSPSTFNCSNVGSSALPVTPYGWWKAENNFQDQTSNGNNGSGVLSPSFAAGNCGQGFVFNGVGSHVDVGNNTNFNGTSAMTIAAWIKPGSNGDEDQIVSKSTHGVPSSWEFRKYGQTLQYTYKATNGVQYAVSANVLVANTWQHVAATWDGTTMKLYHNGSLVGTSTGAPMAPNNFSMKIGENQGYGDSHGAYQGNIDEVMFFTSALTASQVSSIMPCGGSTANAVTVTVTDVNGNVSTGTAQVTVKDLIPPTAVAQNVTINLDANGAASTTASAVNNGSSDNCGIASIALSKTSFDCSNVGSNNVTLTVTDVNGNVSTASAVVTVVDAIAPTAVAQNVTINLDANGAASTTASAVNNGSSDNCGIASIALSKTSFDCSNVGSNNVTLTVTDVNGNVSTASAVVTVVDPIAPTAVAQNVTINLDANGAASTTASAVNNGSSDNCGIASIALSKTSFDCSNVGSNNVTLTVTDVNGNVSTASAVVTVVDAIAPTAVAQNVTINLDANGAASTTASAVNNGSSDNCGIASIALSKTSFDCSNVGSNNVTLTVTDVNGNVSTASAVVTVVDAIAPTAVAQNVTVTLVNGAASVTAAQVNNGSLDNCGIASLSVSPNSFTCSNIGSNPVVLTVTDVNGNVSTANAVVTVVGAIPTVSIGQSMQPGFTQGGAVVLTATSPTAVSYAWTGGPSTPVYYVYGSGTYVVTVTNSFGCTATTNTAVTYNASNMLSSYTIIGREEVELKDHVVVVNGSVGATDSDGEVEVEDFSTVSSSGSFVRAKEIEVKSSSVVTTKIYTQVPTSILPLFLTNPYCNNSNNNRCSHSHHNSCNNHSGCTSSNSSNNCYHSHHSGNCANNSNNGSINKNIAQNTTVVITDSLMGTVVIGKNAIVTFTAPTIYMKGLEIGEGASIRFTQCTKIRVCNQVKFNKNVQFNKVNSTIVTLYVDDKILVSEGAQVEANLYSRGEVDVNGKSGSVTSIKGMVIGEKVEAEKYVNFYWNTNTVCVNNNYKSEFIAEESGLITSYFDANVYPNPAVSSFKVRLMSSVQDVFTVEIYDMSGRLVESKHFSDSSLEAEMGINLSEGVYLVKITQGEQQKTVKVVRTNK